MANLNRQIRSLVPGQTIRGEIISRNGSDVQIKLADDMVLQAKIDQNMNLEVGKSMTFEVRNNGTALTLSPLFENTSADMNVLKALDMAGLPVNETSVSMTRQLMEAGLPVDRNSLQQVYREIASFPQAQVSDVVNLHKLGLPVDETNINQMIAYRNLTHQLTEGMNTVLGAMPDAMEGMVTEGNLQGLAGLYQELFDLVQEGAGEGVLLPRETASQGMDAPVSAEQASMPEQALLGALEEADAHVGSTPVAAAGMLLEEMGTGAVAGLSGQEGTQAGAVQEAVGTTETAATVGTTQGETVLSAVSRQALSEQLLSVLSELPLGAEEAGRLAEQLKQFGQGNLSTEEFFAATGRLLQAARTSENGVQNLHRIFSGEDFKNLLNASLKSLWTVRPEELASPGKVEELYRRMDRQLKSLAQALENGGQAESGAFRATANMTQNIDFMNQLNQMYTYVQLPLHMSQGEAHGDLYVFTNRRNLAAKDGKISALLHLDMEHLGPVDVYVTLEQSKVNTKFYVRDDEMLDFLEAHMHILTERLQERGYDCSFSMTIRAEEKGKTPTSGIGPILEQEKGMLITQYAFDVRT